MAEHATQSDQLSKRGSIVVNGPGAAPASLRVFVTTRLGGHSAPPYDSLNVGTSVGDDPAAVRKNLRAVEAAAEAATGDWVRVHMTHGPRVLRATAPGPAGQADGLVTVRPGLALAITVADCVPLFLWGPGPSAALLHCGWRGIAAGIVEGGVAWLRALSASAPQSFAAWIGPGIGPCCYEVGWDVAVRVAPSPPGGAGGRVKLDLPGEIRRRLAASGLPGQAIRSSSHCTACRPDLYFSHRRDKGRTGRMLAVLRIAP